MTLKVIVNVVLIVNVVGFLFMLIDKTLAIKQKWRISERALLSFVFIGGGTGILLGMIVCRHKLSKLKFRVIAPIGVLLLWFFGYYMFMSNQLILNTLK